MPGQAPGSEPGNDEVIRALSGDQGLASCNPMVHSASCPQVNRRQGSQWLSFSLGHSPVAQGVVPGTAGHSSNFWSKVGGRMEPTSGVRMRKDGASLIYSLVPPPDGPGLLCKHCQPWCSVRTLSAAFPQLLAQAPADPGVHRAQDGARRRAGSQEAINKYKWSSVHLRAATGSQH